MRRSDEMLPTGNKRRVHIGESTPSHERIEISEPSSSGKLK
jgi:hypothetical protein